MAATVSFSNTQTYIDQTLNKIVVTGTITLTGNYGTASSHGDTLNLAVPGMAGVNSIPTIVTVYEYPPAGTAPTGYMFGYAPGTTQQNGVLTIMNGAATEYSEGSAYSAPLLAAVIQFRAEFPNL